MQESRYKTAITVLAVVLSFFSSVKPGLTSQTEGGKTYEIAEPDLLEEIEAQKVVLFQRFKKYLEKEKQKLLNSTPAVHLSPADRSYTYSVDMTYELPFDIPEVDRQGRITGVIYPKGYRFNPLKYLHGSPPVLIVFNAEDSEEVSCVEGIREKYPYHLLIISDGNLSVSEKLGERVYFLNQRIVDRLKLVHTISVVNWDTDNGTAVIQVLKKEECLEGEKIK